MTSGLNAQSAVWGTTSSPTTSITASTMCTSSANKIYFKGLGAPGATVTLSAFWERDIRPYAQYFIDKSINSSTIKGYDNSAKPTLTDSQIESLKSQDYDYVFSENRVDILTNKGFMFVTNPSEQVLLVNDEVVLHCDVQINDETSFDADGFPSGGDGTLYLWNGSGIKNMTFIGNSKYIRGLYIDDGSTSRAASLFGDNIGSVKNVNFDNFYINCAGQSAAIAGSCDTLVTCIVTNSQIYGNKCARSSRACRICCSVTSLIVSDPTALPAGHPV